MNNNYTPSGKKQMNEWKATKVHMYAHVLSWEDLLQFDTTARYSCH